MQTFLPYPDFTESAKVLDMRRLGKQRVEAYQIINILTGQTQTQGWKNHPAVRMWQGFEQGLMIYFNEMVWEWKRRGYHNNMKLYKVPLDSDLPEWMGSENFHASHRSNLLRKDPIYYGKFGWTETLDLPYVWPL